MKFRKVKITNLLTKSIWNFNFLYQLKGSNATFANIGDEMGGIYRREREFTGTDARRICAERERNRCEENLCCCSKNLFSGLRSGPTMKNSSEREESAEERTNSRGWWRTDRWRSVTAAAREAVESRSATHNGVSPFARGHGTHTKCLLFCQKDTDWSSREKTIWRISIFVETQVSYEIWRIRIQGPGY